MYWMTWLIHKSFSHKTFFSIYITFFGKEVNGLNF